MPSLRDLKLPSIPNPKLSFGSRSAPDVVGLDIQPGFVAAVQVKVNGAILAQRAAALPLSGDAVREGEVIDQEALAKTLRELFDNSDLGRRVRVGVANQRTVMRMLELPPVTDQKELAAAVRFQAQDQVPMPLDDAVIDFHPLGVVDTPGGPRQRVLLVAAQRDMVQRLMSVAEAAGLRIEGIDLSAFALIRSLHRAVAADVPDTDRVLYLNIDGLTNLAIAEGTTCRFTRVVGGGMEALAAELAERRGIALNDARTLITTVDLTATPGAEKIPSPPAPEGELSEHDEPPTSELPLPEPHGATDEEGVGDAVAAAEALAAAQATPEEPAPLSAEDHEAHEESMSYAEMYPAASLPLGEHEDPVAAPSAPTAPAPRSPSDADVRAVLENGIREISGQVRTSLEFYRSQDGGSEVSHVVMSGSALDVPGFAEALQTSLGLDVHAETVGLADDGLEGKISTHRLAVAAGLATMEAPR